MLGLHVATGPLRRYPHDGPEDGEPSDGLWITVNADDHDPVAAGRPAVELVTVILEPHEDGVTVELRVSDTVEGTLGAPVDDRSVRAFIAITPTR